MNLETLSLETIADELVFLKKTGQKITDSGIAKEYYNSYLKRKSTKSVKTIENNYSTNKNFLKN